VIILSAKLGELITKFIEACRDIDLKSIDLKARVKVKVTKMTEEVFNDLAKAGLEMAEQEFDKDKKFVLPWAGGWIHYSNIEKLTSIEGVEFVDFDTKVKTME
jgi:hypothetical protein